MNLSIIPPLPESLRASVEEDYKANPYICYSSLSLEEAVTVASVVNGFKLEKTLEIGLAGGSSAAAVISAKKYSGLNGEHIAVDPYQHSHSRSEGVKAIERLGYFGHFRLIEDWSEHYLPRHPGQLDFILIDGGHGSGQAMVDAYFSDRLLRLGGIIAIDDIYIKSTARSILFLTEECGYEVVDCCPNIYRMKFIPQFIRRSVRLGVGYTRLMMTRCVDALAVLRKTKEYHGGY